MCGERDGRGGERGRKGGRNRRRRGRRRGDYDWEIKELFWSMLLLILLKDIFIDGFINIISVSGIT